ncbi:hypothetical protein BAE27_03930 [Acidithiobacillus caldus]|uniref:H(+)-transporting two-sector ATPase n=1 Tax=Acidithiobacillus caldus TaxID=33059 RepID=A0A1E7YPG4_9PROT|nr:hypothetical protein BAE27_03930 [Acidithiobacillus caldus]
MADAARSILDGHIVLSRDLAAAGVLPAIDPAVSASRVMRSIVDTEHLALVQRVMSWWGNYREKSDLIAIGAYHQGSDPTLDMAMQKYPAILDFLRQHPEESSHFSASLSALRQLVEEP